MLNQFLLAAAFCITYSVAQMSSAELDVLFNGLADRPIDALEKSKMTDDPTVTPLIDLQIFAPPVVPSYGDSCEVVLLQHTFGVDSYNKPAVVPYAPPTDAACGSVGEWAAISMNLSVYSIGTQYDRFGSIYLSHVEIWRTSSAEPTETGTIWNTSMLPISPSLRGRGDFMMDFSNIISDELDAAFDVIITATFYAPTRDFPTPKTSDFILPLSNLSPNTTNLFTLDDDTGGTTNVSLPPNTTEAYIEVFCSGNSAEEFWYLNTPDEFVDYFPESTGPIGIKVLVDGQLAGVVWPYAVIYTGGITPSNWRPLASYGAYDAPTYWIDATPFLPVLLDGSKSHSVTLQVRGQGTNPSINSNWFISGSIHGRLGASSTTGRMTTYDVGDTGLQTMGGASEDNTTVWTSVVAERHLHIQSELHTSEGKKVVSFSQSLSYSNDAAYADQGRVQWGNQTTKGITLSKHNDQEVLRDAFEYPLNVFSNYSLSEMQFGGYGSDIKQTHARAIQLPTGPYKSIYSVQHANGWMGINGTGETTQTFAYTDTTKNDGWVHDIVWGSLRDSNPPVPDNQIYGPEGGPGF
ncbi:hypothetical protein BDZ89DRAFT_1075418 [Hymenopellis radicata]|nr:hypothetical protein BDZ89DRAFT_1075418 [Hymenopellis radicata]